MDFLIIKSYGIPTKCHILKTLKSFLPIFKLSLWKYKGFIPLLSRKLIFVKLTYSPVRLCSDWLSKNTSRDLHLVLSENATNIHFEVQIVNYSCITYQDLVLFTRNLGAENLTHPRVHTVWLLIEFYIFIISSSFFSLFWPFQPELGLNFSYKSLTFPGRYILQELNVGNLSDSVLGHNTFIAYQYLRIDHNHKMGELILFPIFFYLTYLLTFYLSHILY